MKIKINKLPSKNQDLKILNRLLVRNIIYKYGPISRHEIANITGLTPSTVTVIVSKMLKDGIVKEVGSGESSGGRRPVMLELNSRAGFIFAIRLQKGEAVTAIFDLAGNILNQHQQILNTINYRDVIKAIGSSFDWLIHNTNIRKEKILWCGLATPGLINHNSGVIVKSSNLNWKNVPISQCLSERLGGIPVHIENNSNAAALAEMVYGNGRGCENLIYLNLSVGISAGIIVEGKVYGGVNGYAGELGHTTLYPEGGPQCTCGRVGCFEAICGMQAILKRVQEEISEDVFKAYGLNKSKITNEHILTPPLIDIPEVRRILTNTGHLIGVAVANLLSLFNTKRIILGGELAKIGDLLLQSVISTVKERVLEEIYENVKILVSRIDKDPQLLGAYELALEKLFAAEEWYKAV